MKIEDIAAPPPRLAPQMRYASLHRTIESGLATDRTWVELVEACLELGRHGEAEQGFWQIKDASARRRILTPLQKHGLLLDVSLGATADLEKPGRPAADSRQEEGFGERIADAVHFLFVDHMPMTTVVATVTFPVVVGLGGLLQGSTQGGPLLLLLAAIPALSVVGLVAALCRRILVDASRGLDDPPEIPGLTDLCRDAARIGVDLTVLIAALVGPSLAALGLGLVPETATAAAIASVVLGAMVVPIAFGLRQTREDWTCLRPDTLLLAVVRGGRRHLGTVLVLAALAAPAGIALWATLGAPLYLALAVTGPLAVAPAFLAARLLGQLLYDRRNVFPGAAVPLARAAPNKRRTPARTRRSAPRPSPKAERRHPEAEPARPASAGPQGGGLLRVDPVPSGHERPRRARPEADARPAPATPSVHQEPHLVATSRDVVGEAPLDLTTLPGFSVVKGDARIAAGAASTKRH
jgi:hypothetical protein